jgi:L-ascorbate metabolism protein UlaG (beta-lactamase superfamily)
MTGFLRSSIRFEPLVSRWYAWSHLIAPHTAAMNTVHRHLKIMQSYVDNPDVHESAVRNPALAGGPFLDVPRSQQAQVQRLLSDTRTRCRDLIELSDAIQTCSDLLASQGTGASLERLYPQVPDALRGVVELVYDACHAPALRFLEALLYRSKHYRPQDQELVGIETTGDHRPFILSTPRVTADDGIPIALPFADPRLDQLYAARRQPGRCEALLDVLRIAPEHVPRFRSWFCDAPPRAPANREYRGDGVRLRYFGHACVLVQTDEVSILTDPVISYDVPGEVPRFTFSDLPDVIDYVVLTHNHQDHVVIESLLELRGRIKTVIYPGHETGFLADPSMRLILSHLGFRSLIGLHELESHAVPGGEILGLPFLGEHADLNIQSKRAYRVALKDRTIVFAADSNNLEPRLYELIAEQIGGADVIFLGMECDGAPLSWLYGPLLTRPITRKDDRSRRLSGSDCARALALVERLAPRQVWVYAMGAEPWLGYIMSLAYTAQSRPIVESDQLVAACRARGIESERLFGAREWQL